MPSPVANLNPSPCDNQLEKEPSLIALASRPCEGWRPVRVNSQLLKSPVQQGLQQALKEGEDVSAFSLAYPVFEAQDAQGNLVRQHAPIPFQQLNELKMACAQYGPTAPFTLAVLDSLATEALPPSDWKQIAKACLAGGDYLLWKSEYSEQCEKVADFNRQQGELSVIYEMLAGEGTYAEVTQQLGFPPGVYAQINTAAKNAWKILPSSERASEDISKIRQGPDEPFQNFLDRLLQTASRVIGESEAGIVLVKQLAYENANSACQAALHPFRKKADLSGYVRLCADIGPSYTQGLAMAAALQGKTVKEVLYQQHRRGPPKKGNNGNWFGCGQAGHLIRDCPQCKKNGSFSKPPKEPGLCPKCKRGKHWTNECRSKKDIMGNPIQSGNGWRGQPQAPYQSFGAFQNPKPQIIPQNQSKNPFRTYPEPPQAV
ncbi:endogenous retrovirus group K member 10 Gag polyprotein-like [Fukomys damarensis]|uniref:endogenous retrovirus group K member 10 Gag polyprotein-like n=1 Tax=Fukomys damarensis TaxID=885580 RepID=UPI00053FE230|nr:endogenous retrovirus group K member 10 Gag polyprotein-like [Fukomys damarensis]